MFEEEWIMVTVNSFTVEGFVQLVRRNLNVNVSLAENNKIFTKIELKIWKNLWNQRKMTVLVRKEKMKWEN